MLKVLWPLCFLELLGTLKGQFGFREHKEQTDAFTRYGFSGNLAALKEFRTGFAQRGQKHWSNSWLWSTLLGEFLDATFCWAISVFLVFWVVLVFLVFVVLLVSSACVTKDTEESTPTTIPSETLSMMSGLPAWNRCTKVVFLVKNNLFNLFNLIQFVQNASFSFRLKHSPNMSSLSDANYSVSFDSNVLRSHEMQSMA